MSLCHDHHIIGERRSLNDDYHYWAGDHPCGYLHSQHSGGGCVYLADGESPAYPVPGGQSCQSRTGAVPQAEADCEVSKTLTGGVGSSLRPHFYEVNVMWYAINHPATWAGLNSFLSGVLALISATFDAMLGQPVMVLFLSAFLMAAVLLIFRDMFRTSKDGRR